MTFLFILNDAPYASERDYNALRLATELGQNPEHTVRVFLLGDAVPAAAAGQSAPEGMHDIEWMLRRYLAGGRETAACGTCMDARGLTDDALIDGVRRGTLAGLADWTATADRVLVF